MAMTAAVKDELSRVELTKSCCRKAEVATMLRFAGGLHLVAGHIVIEADVDTGATARVVREMLPKAHFATVYAKPAGRPLVDTFITEVSQDTWIYLPWDMHLTFAPPIGDTATA